MKHKMEFNRLSQISSNVGIRFSHSAATPGSHCPMHTALAAIKNISGVSSLVVGMPECGYYSRYVMDNPVGKNGELHYVYILDSNEVVFGCLDGLREALITMEEDGAKAVVVIMTCIPALIGEDIYGIMEELNSKLQMKAVCIDMAHFKRNGYEAGFYEAFGSLAAFFSEKAENSGKGVNIFGTLKGAEGKELKDILGENGYEISNFTPVFDLDMLKSSLNCRLTIVTDIHMLPLANNIKERYSIPYVFLGGSYDVERITAFYEEIFHILHIQFSSEQFKEKFSFYNKLNLVMNENKKVLKGIPFIVTCVLPDVLSITSFLCSLNMRPVLLHLEEYNEWMKEWKSEILNGREDPYITYMIRNEGIGEWILEYFTANGRTSEKVRLEEINQTECKSEDIRPIEIIPERKQFLSLGSFSWDEAGAVVDDNELRPLTVMAGFERTFKLINILVNKLKAGDNFKNPDKHALGGE